MDAHSVSAHRVGQVMAMSNALSAQDFASKVLCQPLWPHQVELAEGAAFITTVAAARRTGKTECAEVMAMHTAFGKRNVKVLILSATQEAARRLTESIGARLASNRLTAGAVVDDYATRIRLTNGSEIISLPASQRQVRGYGKGVRLVILDEAGFMPGELWAAAHYTALDERANGSRILILGTPFHVADHFFRRAYEAGLDGDPDHASFHWTYEANPYLDRAYLERQRDRISPAEYHSEVLGEWSDAVGSLFSRELLEAATADVVLPALGELQGPARGIVGCDWGVSFDRSAAVGIYRLPVAALNEDREPRPCFIAVPWVWPVRTPLGATVETIAAVAHRFGIVASETNGIGAMPTQELFRRARIAHPQTRFTWVPVSTTSASKTAGYGALLGLLERGQLVLPRHPDLLRQLAGLKFEQRERGFTHISAEDAAVHDDVADAAMLAALPYRPSGAKRIICHLSTLAGSRGVAPDARVPELDSPVVTTGAGLRLHQRPALQGVTTSELSLYAPLAPQRPVGIHAGRFFFRTTTQGVTHA